MSTENNNGIYFPQDYTLSQCQIVTAVGQYVDFAPIVLEMNIYSDLFSPVMTGNILVSDSSGFLNLLSFSGNEFIKIKLEKPSLQQNITKTFRIFRISDRKRVNEQNEMYILHFCSEELLLSEEIKISKSYPGKRISEIVTDILKNQLKVNSIKYKDSYIEETQGTYNFIIPSMKPFEATNWLSTYAISNSSKNDGASYLFYEDNDGFKFKSLVSLCQQPSTRTFVYGIKNINDLTDPRVKNMDISVSTVLSYEHINDFDTLDGTMNGAFASTLTTIDTILRKYTTTNFDYQKYFNRNTFMNKNPVMSNYKNRFNKQENETSDAVQKVMTTNTTQNKNAYIKSKDNIKPINIETYIPYRTAQLALLTYNRMRIAIAGDPSIKVGDRITFYFYNINSDDQGRKLDQFYSGDFLVTAIRHKIDQENKYVSILEICKDSMPDSYLQFQNNTVAWKNIRSE